MKIWRFRLYSRKFQLALTGAALICRRNTGKVLEERDMDIVYAAEKPSIARLLSEHMRRRVRPEEIKVTENPDETGSFYIGFDMDKFVLSPSGEIESDRLQIVK